MNIGPVLLVSLLLMVWFLRYDRSLLIGDLLQETVQKGFLPGPRRFKELLHGNHDRENDEKVTGQISPCVFLAYKVKGL